MHIKRFEAATMKAALAQVKAELGPDALILSSRTFRRGRQAFGLMANTRVEVQAALERGSLGAHALGEGGSMRTREDSPEAAVPNGLAEDREGWSDSKVPQSATSPERKERSMLEDFRKELAILRGRERFEEEVRSELRGLRSAMQGVLGSRLRDAADPLAESLSRAGLDWAHAGSLVTAWRARESGDEAESLEAFLTARIESRLSPPRVEDGSRVRILVGAPGVGKTTTLAKLAARNDEGEREVALISLDHYRIGAADQLRRYADLLHSPFSEVDNARALRDEVERFPGHAVLIDTAGRGQKAVAELDSLLPLREALGDQASIELVMDATVRLEVQRAQLARFAPLAPDRIIFAKTDECESLADVANLVLDSNCPPLCWLGTGQRVPEDLEVVEAQTLAREVLGEAA